MSNAQRKRKEIRRLKNQQAELKEEITQLKIKLLKYELIDQKPRPHNDDAVDAMTYGLNSSDRSKGWAEDVYRQFNARMTHGR